MLCILLLDQFAGNEKVRAEEAVSADKVTESLGLKANNMLQYIEGYVQKVLSTSLKFILQCNARWYEV